MIFTNMYTKLTFKQFTTIRKNTGRYKQDKTITVKTPDFVQKAIVLFTLPIKKEDITESLAQFDADCSKEELIKKLEGWYGKKFNDYVLIFLSWEEK